MATTWAMVRGFDAMPPAARLTDMHVCPAFTGPVPHVGGPILPPCEPTVLIGELPAARMSDMAECIPAIDTIVMGSPTVLIGNLMAARIGDPCAHGGVIVMGCPTVIIGDAGSGDQSNVMQDAKDAGAALVPLCGGPSGGGNGNGVGGDGGGESGGL
jgi:uncharacterized Zn-binding protein involved in type VI secretion